MAVTASRAHSGSDLAVCGRTLTKRMTGQHAMETTELGLVPICLPGSGPVCLGILRKNIHASVALSTLVTPTDRKPKRHVDRFCIHFGLGATDSHIARHPGRDGSHWAIEDSSGSHLDDGRGRNFFSSTQPRGGPRNRHCTAGSEWQRYSGRASRYMVSSPG